MIPRFFDRFRKDSRGVLAVEFALTVPILALILTAGVETARLVLINQKVDRATATMADLVAQSRQLAEGDLGSIYAASRYVMEPYDLNAGGTVVVTSISADGGAAPIVNWQRAFGTGGAASHFGSPGTAAVLPAGFQVRDTESVIVSEVFYDFKPLIANAVISSKPIYNYAIYRPRFVPLTSVLP